MVRTTLEIGRGVDDTRSIRDMGANTKRKENQSSSNSGNKRKTSIPLGFQGRGNNYQSQGQAKTFSQSGQMTCFHCHQPGHVRRDYLQRQGSHGYGTPQSQSLVGHEHTQFVPPYPSMGQGNRFKSQGATQVPTISQMGHMG